MKRSRRLISLVMVAALLTGWTVPASAQDNPLRVVFEDAFYGGLIGTLVGGALLAFTKHPSDRLEYLGYGAATGVLAGTAYGLASASKSLAEIDRDGVRFAIPTVTPHLQDNGMTGGQTLALKAELLRGSF